LDVNAPSLKIGVRERVGRDHLDLDAGLGQRALEPGEDPFALGVVRAEGDDVVVVEGHERRAQLGEAVHGLHRVDRCTGRVAELVARFPADRPEAEGELVLGGGHANHLVSSSRAGPGGRAGPDRTGGGYRHRHLLFR